jgi:hypothetical protein
MNNFQSCWTHVGLVLDDDETLIESELLHVDQFTHFSP